MYAPDHEESGNWGLEARKNYWWLGLAILALRRKSLVDVITSAYQTDDHIVWIAVVSVDNTVVSDSSFIESAEVFS